MCVVKDLLDSNIVFASSKDELRATAVLAFTFVN